MADECIALVAKRQHVSVRRMSADLCPRGSPRHGEVKIPGRDLDVTIGLQVVADKPMTDQTVIPSHWEAGCDPASGSSRCN
jgi:hypothetical protein